MQSPEFTVSEFIETCNQTLDYAYQNIVIAGEVSGFKINQGKWVFFDLKDENSSISCFMPLAWLSYPLEDGLKVKIKATPKLTKWGKFSLTARQIMPIGAGNIKKSFEILKAKLAKEGLFDPAKKRPLPKPLEKIGVISSTQAAGYADFIKIVNERWGGLQIQVAHTAVQGIDAPSQIIRALNYFNQHQTVQVIAILRGGGSADDLAAFNDETLARAISASRIPVITGIGHEVDESLSDLVADFAASTPSNVAQILTLDRQAEIKRLQNLVSLSANQILSQIDFQHSRLSKSLDSMQHQLIQRIYLFEQKLLNHQTLLKSLNPETILKRGYAILSGKIQVGETVTLTTAKNIIQTEVKNVKKR